MRFRRSSFIGTSGTRSITELARLIAAYAAW
jgi:hypothetical protein